MPAIWPNPSSHWRQRAQGDRTGAGRHARKRAAELLGAGVGAVHNWVKAYREDGLTAHVPERRGYGSYEGETTPAPDNLADRDFTAEMPNGKRPADITRNQGRGRERRASRRRPTATTAGSSRTRPVPVPTPGSPTGCSPRAVETLPEGAASLGAFRPLPPLPVARMAGAHGPLRPDTVDGRQRPFPGQRRRGGVPRTHEDGIRPSRALGGAYPRRGARPGRRPHPLARPRAHQTAARLDESGTIPSEPGNGCVTISKKTSAAPYLHLKIKAKNIAVSLTFP